MSAWRGEIDQELIKLYNVYRDYVKHEDGLINNRMTWLITTQSFIIAGFVLSFQEYYKIFSKRVEINSSQSMFISLNDMPIVFLVSFLCAIGFSSALISKVSLDAASEAVNSLRDKWEFDCKNHKDFDSLPKLTGGNSSEATKSGLDFVKFSYLAFSLLWLSIFIIISIGVSLCINVCVLTSFMIFMIFMSFCGVLLFFDRMLRK